MYTIFDKAARDGLINRINSLNNNCSAQWGEMNVNQMIRHCIMWEEVALGKRKLKNTFLGLLLGKLFFKGIVKDDTPLKRFLPAVNELKVKEDVNSDIEAEKRKWISLISEYPQLSAAKCQLPFFGYVKKEQAGYVAYKHSDHHLRQFNV